MRSIIIFALVALAVCQNPLFDAMTGFNNKLGVSGNDNGNNCLTGLITELYQAAPLYQDYVAENLIALATDASAFAEGFEPAVQAACQPFAEDLNNYAVTFGNGKEPKLNAILNFPYVAQQAATLIVNVEQQDFTAVGETLGYIFQILIGAVDLESVLPAPLTYEQELTIQQNAESLLTNQEALTQYIQAFVEGYGVADSVNVTAIVQLVTETEGLLFAALTLEAQIANGNFDSDITATESFINTVLETVRNNQEGLQSIAAIDGPILEAFINNPVQVTALTLFNTFFNYPEIMQLNNQMQQELLDGDFSSVGTTAAQSANIIYANVLEN